MYIEKVLDLWVQLMKNGGKNKNVAFIILVSIYYYIKSTQLQRNVHFFLNEKLHINPKYFCVYTVKKINEKYFNF